MVHGRNRVGVVVTTYIKPKVRGIKSVRVKNGTVCKPFFLMLKRDTETRVSMSNQWKCEAGWSYEQAMCETEAEA